MGHTLAEKIIGAHVVDENGAPAPRAVKPGDLVEAAADIVLANDITAPISPRAFAA